MQHVPTMSPMRARWLHHYLALALDLGYVVLPIYSAWAQHEQLRPLCTLTLQDQIDYVLLAVPPMRQEQLKSDTLRFYNSTTAVWVRDGPTHVRWDWYQTLGHAFWKIQKSPQQLHTGAGHNVTPWCWHCSAAHCTELLDQLVALVKS
jgi:hypothetical protein